MLLASFLKLYRIDLVLVNLGGHFRLLLAAKLATALEIRR